MQHTPSFPETDDPDSASITLTDAAEGDGCFGKRDDGRTVLVHPVVQQVPVL